MLNIITGKQKRPQRVVIYGGEGLGQTTMVDQIPDVLVIDCYTLCRVNRLDF